MTREELYDAATRRANDIARATREKTIPLEKQKDNIIYPRLARRGFDSGVLQKTLVLREQIDGRINALNEAARDRIDKIAHTLPKDTPDEIKQSIRDSSERILTENPDGKKVPPRKFSDRGYLTSEFNEKAASPPGGGGDKGRSPDNPHSPGSGGGPDRNSPAPQKDDKGEESKPSRFMQSFNRASAKSPESRQQEQTKAEGPSPSGFLNGSMGRAAQEKGNPQQEKTTPPQQEKGSAAGFMQSFNRASQRTPANDQDKGRSQEARPVKTGSGRDDR